MAGVLFLEADLAGAGDVEQGHGVARQLAGLEGVEHALERHGRGRVDVDAFRVEEEFLHRPDVVVGGAFHVAARVAEGIVQTALDAVGRTPVGEHLGVDGQGFPARIVVVHRQERTAARLPGVVHRQERDVLRREELHLVAAETAVADQAEVGLPGGDGAGARSDGLEIGVGDVPDDLCGREDGGGHPVAAGDVLGAAFGEEHRRGAGGVAQGDGVEIVGSLRRADEFHAVAERMFEPQGADVFLRNGKKEGNLILRADLGEGAGRVAGRRHHQDALLAFRQPGAHAVGLRLLEGTGGHRTAFLGPVSRKCDVEVGQSQPCRQLFALEGDRGGGSLEHPPDRHPVGELVDAAGSGSEGDLFLFVNGADQRGLLALRVGQHPAGVFETAARGHRLQPVSCRLKDCHMMGINRYRGSLPVFGRNRPRGPWRSGRRSSGRAGRR